MSSQNTESQPTLSELSNLETSPRKQDWLMSKFPTNFGWLILAVAALGRFMSIPGQTVGVAGFLDSIIADLQMERSAVSLIFSVGTLVASLSLTYVGHFVDKNGPRRSIVLISLGLVFACVWMGFVQEAITLTIGFVLLRGLGQGALTLVSIQAINLWFVRQRGLSIGIASLGFALGGAIFPVLVERLIPIYGWRQTYWILALIVALSILPLGALVFRNRPEEYGLQPDGRPTAKHHMPIPEVSYTLAEARKTVSFWLFSIGDFFVAGFGTGLIFHFYDIVSVGGLDRATASYMFVILGAVIASSNFITGLALDRIPPRLLVSVMLIFLCITLVMSTYVSSFPTLIIFTLFLGTGGGMRGVLDGAIYAHYFGRLHSGSIKGFAAMISIAGTAAGPIILALGRDLFGSYTLITLLLAVPPFLFACFIPLIARARLQTT